MKLYFQDHLTESETWKGLLLSVDNPRKPPIRLHTAHPGLMKLSANDEALLWGHIDPDYCGVHVLRRLPESADLEILPRIRSSDIERAAESTGEAWQKYWAKLFARSLQNSSMSPLYSGLWALEFCETGHHTNSPRWLGKTKWVQETDEDRAYLSAHKLYVDWGVTGNGSILTLFLPHQLPEQAGRIKWWLKVSHSSQLPPILVWFIGSLDAFVVLDGHDRLQAALITGIPPTFLVLNSYMERTTVLDEKIQNAITHQLEIMQKNIDDGITINQSAFSGVQQALVQAFDNRPRKIPKTYGYADMPAEQWYRETKDFEILIETRNGSPSLEEFYITD